MYICIYIYICFIDLSDMAEETKFMSYITRLWQRIDRKMYKGEKKAQHGLCR